jgi:hypothetical protein
VPRAQLRSLWQFQGPFHFERSTAEVTTQGQIATEGTPPALSHADTLSNTLRGLTLPIRLRFALNEIVLCAPARLTPEIADDWCHRLSYLAACVCR